MCVCECMRVFLSGPVYDCVYRNADIKSHWHTHAYTHKKQYKHTYLYYSEIPLNLLFARFMFLVTYDLERGKRNRNRDKFVPDLIWFTNSNNTLQRHSLSPPHFRNSTRHTNRHVQRRLGNEIHRIQSSELISPMER